MTTVREIRRNRLMSRYWRWRWNRSKCYRCDVSPAVMYQRVWGFILWWACYDCGVKKLEEMS